MGRVMTEEEDDEMLQAAVDELAAVAGGESEAARIIRAAASLVRELRREDRVEGKLCVRMRQRPGRGPSLGDVQHDVTTRVL